MPGVNDLTKKGLLLSESVSMHFNARSRSQCFFVQSMKYLRSIQGSMSLTHRPDQGPPTTGLSW